MNCYRLSGVQKPNLNSGQLTANRPAADNKKANDIQCRWLFLLTVFS